MCIIHGAFFKLFSAPIFGAEKKLQAISKKFAAIKSARLVIAPCYRVINRRELFQKVSGLFLAPKIGAEKKLEKKLRV